MVKPESVSQSAAKRGHGGRFLPGTTPGPGRPPGPNKLTADIRNMVREALDEAGGVEYLTRQADENPVAFLGLVGRILPKDVTVSVISHEELVVLARERALRLAPSSSN